jgi:phosphoribosylamine--glycine ligase
LIIVGSDSDLPVMQAAADLLREFQIPYLITIASAHRTPERAKKLASEAAGRGIDVIIAGAGMAAHLAGVLASHTILPVIGVPLDASSVNGLDSLLSTVQMPAGVPVAAMAIGKAGAKNAAIFAAQIIGRKDTRVADRLIDFKRKMALEVGRKVKALEGNKK